MLIIILRSVFLTVAIVTLILSYRALDAGQQRLSVGLAFGGGVLCLLYTLTGES